MDTRGTVQASLQPRTASLREFRAMYETHHGFVWHALHRFGVAPAVVEDAVQDVFVVAYRRRHDFEGRSTKAWLYGIARRVASNRRRAAGRREGRERAAGWSSGVLASAATLDAILALDEYLDSLSPEDRELFVLSEVEGMTGPEIADLRGRNVQTIYTRIRKLRGESRAQLVDAAAVREARPRATARAWAALMPLLADKAAPATGFTALLSTKLAGGAIGAGLGLVVLVGADAVLPEAPQPAVVSAATVPEPDPRPRGEPKPAPATSVAAPAPAPSAAPAGVAVDPEPTPPKPAARPQKKEPPKPANTLAEENALLRQAAAALRSGDASEALHLADRHASRFGKSPLADLREALRVEALCELGQRKDAVQVARQLVARSPDSPVRRRVEKSCAGPPYEPPSADMAGT